MKFSHNQKLGYPHPYLYKQASFPIALNLFESLESEGHVCVRFPMNRKLQSVSRQLYTLDETQLI